MHFFHFADALILNIFVISFLLMRAVIQRVRRASVRCESGHIDTIGLGLLVFLGIEPEDTAEDIRWLSNKISKLRIFDDVNKVMNLSLSEINGEIMVISQFTLHALIKKGNRPSYIKAAQPSIAIPLYESFLKQLLIDSGKKPKKGVFGNHMDVDLLNDGPVTLIIDTKNKE